MRMVILYNIFTNVAMDNVGPGYRWRAGVKTLVNQSTRAHCALLLQRVVFCVKVDLVHFSVKHHLL